MKLLRFPCHLAFHLVKLGIERLSRIHHDIPSRLRDLYFNESGSSLLTPWHRENVFRHLFLLVNEVKICR